MKPIQKQQSKTIRGGAGSFDALVQLITWLDPKVEPLKSNSTYIKLNRKILRATINNPDK